jgi:hypothetical protein
VVAAARLADAIVGVFVDVVFVVVAETVARLQTEEGLLVFLELLKLLW